MQAGSLICFSFAESPEKMTLFTLGRFLGYLHQAMAELRSFILVGTESLRFSFAIPTRSRSAAKSFQNECQLIGAGRVKESVGFWYLFFMDFKIRTDEGFTKGFGVFDARAPALPERRLEHEIGCPHQVDHFQVGNLAEKMDLPVYVERVAGLKQVRNRFVFRIPKVSGHSGQNQLNLGVARLQYLQGLG